jgi:hypothetical protein
MVELGVMGRASKSFQVVAIRSKLLLAKLIAVHRLSVGVGDRVAAIGLVSGDRGVVSMVVFFTLGVRSMRAWAVGGVSHGRILRESSEIQNYEFSEIIHLF